MKRGWTQHGHRIQGIEPFESPPDAIVRCGGPSICNQCALDAAAARGDIKFGSVRLNTCTCTPDQLGIHEFDCSMTPRHQDPALLARNDFQPSVMPGYPGQPLAEQAWVKHAADVIADAIKGGANSVVFDVPTQHGEIQFDEAAFLAEQLIADAADQGEFGHPCDPIPCPPMEEHTLRFIQPGRQIAAVRTEDNHLIVDVDLDALQADLRSELAEFKQWASDACELLRDLLPKHTALRRSIDERTLALLARMENP